MATTVRPAIRRNNFDLSDEQVSLRDAFRRFFERQCPSTTVRRAESEGFDRELWARLQDLGVDDMGDADHASLHDLALVAEESGRALAPVPLVEALVARRSLVRVGAAAAEVLADHDRELVVASPTPASAGVGQLLPGGAASNRVLARFGDDYVVRPIAAELTVPDGFALAVAGWWTPRPRSAGDLVVAEGAAAREHFERTRLEWQLLAAASLVGIAQRALDLAVEYAKERYAFGVPIGTFQAIAHPLVDVATAVVGARRMVGKACWYHDHEPEHGGALARMAFLHAAESASLATRRGIHVQGGFGFTLESDLQLYFKRARLWRLAAGSPITELAGLADDLYGPVARVADPEEAGR